jgi:sporulation protein YlmC with PRC-barrel domain
MRHVLLSLIFVGAASGLAYAQDSAAQPDATTPVENRMDAATPTMKAPDGANQTAPTNRVGDAVPTMKAPDGTDSNATATAPDATPKDADMANTPAGAAPFTVSEADLSKWIGRQVYSSDGKDLGKIAALQRDPDGKVNQIQADIGGFLGFGETRVRFTADQIKQVKADSLVVSLTEAEAKSLPPIDKQ